jgi:hypothetical protein
LQRRFDHSHFPEWCLLRKTNNDFICGYSESLSKFVLCIGSSEVWVYALQDDLAGVIGFGVIGTQSRAWSRALSKPF